MKKIRNKKLNIRIIHYFNDILTNNEKFRIDKLNITELSIIGNESKLIKTIDTSRA